MYTRSEIMTRNLFRVKNKARTILSENEYNAVISAVSALDTKVQEYYIKLAIKAKYEGVSVDNVRTVNDLAKIKAELCGVKHKLYALKENKVFFGSFYA